MEHIKLFLKGMILGAANIIPGISGGTMAVVFNIYDKIIELISLNIIKIIKAWKFLLPLALGMVAGILTFTHLLSYLLLNFPIPTKYFFIGLIIGSIPLIIKRIKSNHKNTSAIKLILLALCFIVGALAVLSMLFFDKTKEVTAFTLQSSINLKEAFLLFISGAIAAVAMIIPGISGSLLLLSIGMYTVIINAISSFNIIVLLPFVFGVLFGLIAGAFLVRFMMKHIPSYTYSVILGLVASSIFLIFPGIPGLITGIISVIALFAGIATVLFLK